MFGEASDTLIIRLHAYPYGALTLVETSYRNNDHPVINKSIRVWLSHKAYIWPLSVRC